MKNGVNLLLIVEDDESLGQSLVHFLNKEAFQTLWVKSLKELNEIDPKVLNDIDLICLDWMLKDGQGVDYLKKLRQNNLDLPVIMLTSKNELLDKVLGLEMGANDYITKPFEPRELLARIRVQLRDQLVLSPSSLPSSLLQLGELALDLIGRKAFFKKEIIDLTKTEFDLLKLFLENPQRAFSRDHLLNTVWGYDHFPETRTVDNHVLQLRQKISKDLIETVRGIGYRLNRC